MLDYDQVLTILGEFGTYQKRLCIFMFLMTIPNGLHLTAVVFNNVTPDFRCAIPGLNNDSYTIRDSYHKSLAQAFIPKDDDGEHYSQCKIYDYENTTLIFGSQTTEQNASTLPCHRWVYNDEDGIMSQSVDFNLVCDRAMYKAHGNMMLLAGMLGGSLLGGTLSDAFGRKKTVILGSIAQTIATSLMVLAQDMYLVLAVRFFITFTGTAVFMTIIVLLAETVGISRRSIATLSAMLGFTVGQFVLTLIQFLERDWRTAQMIQSLPFVTLIVFWWLIDESPRWLLSKNRRKEAMSIISHIAKVNKVNLPQEMEQLDDTAIKKSHDAMHDGNGDDNSSSGKIKIWHICTNLRIAFRISILSYSWITINMVYYGLMLGVGELIEGDIYVNFSLQSSMEVISHVSCVFILERTGRKKIFCTTMITTGLATFGIGVLVLAQKDIQWLSIVLFCLGKLGIAIGFSLVFIITAELLPTKIRNSGLGFCSFVARFNGIISPYIVSASLLIPGPFGKAFPVLLFGVLSLVSGLSAILLPETRNTKLPETFEENRI